MNLRNQCQKAAISLKEVARGGLLLGHAMVCQFGRLVAGRPAVAVDMETTPCAVCGEPRTWYLFSKRDRFRYSNIKEQRRFDVVKCRSCGHVFINPRIKESSIREIYEQDLFETYKYDSLHRVKVSVLYDAYHDRLQERLETFARYLAIIRKYRSSGKLLDIGTCFAYFLDVARKQGYDVTGVELSRQCVEFSQTALGISSMMQGSILDVHLEPASFDLVTLWHAIEHLYHPAETIRRISGLLKPGGHLFITCPIHTERILVRGVQPTEHIHYFRRDTLIRLVLANFEGDYLAEEDRIFIFRKR